MEFFGKAKVALFRFVAVGPCSLGNRPVDFVAFSAPFQFPDVFGEFCTVFVFLVSEGACVVIVSSFECLFSETDVRFVVVAVVVVVVAVGVIVASDVVNDVIFFLYFGFVNNVGFLAVSSKGAFILVPAVTRLILFLLLPFQYLLVVSFYGTEHVGHTAVAYFQRVLVKDLAQF